MRACVFVAILRVSMPLLTKQWADGKTPFDNVKVDGEGRAQVRVYGGSPPLDPVLLVDPELRGSNVGGWVGWWCVYAGQAHLQEGADASRQLRAQGKPAFAIHVSPYA
jgi:hypothetical protein